jgi:hypothetical protein
MGLEGVKKLHIPFCGRDTAGKAEAGVLLVRASGAALQEPWCVLLNGCDHEEHKQKAELSFARADSFQSQGI